MARLIVLRIGEDLRLMISKLRMALFGHSYGGGCDAWYAIASLLLFITRWRCTAILHLKLLKDREGLWVLNQQKRLLLGARLSTECVCGTAYALLVLRCLEFRLRL